MRVVADASVLIDLIHGEIVVQAARLGLDWLAPDTTVYELAEAASTILAVLQLNSLELSSEQLRCAEALMAGDRALSAPDAHACVLAQSKQALLLTGDARMRHAAEQLGITVHGTLWLLDRMVDAGAVTKERAVVALQGMQRAGSRLPEQECDERVQKWQAR